MNSLLIFRKKVYHQLDHRFFFLNQDGKTIPVKMDTIVSLGTYRYEHPTLWLTMEGDGPTVEAWISASNRICFYDNDILNEFERLE